MMKKAKAIMAAVGGVCTLAAPMLADDLLDAGETGQLVAGVVTAALAVWAVYRVPNQQG
ncbi:hypothetical protein OG559_31065 (plasmid) [Micromonospora sp. NBC_01405]|uniref:hypothetical protein n=1 Tax=Micromonospora sp. NBC_01405 TaxID=2903589 RepID=UPI003243607B